MYTFSVKYFFLHSIYYLSHTSNMGCLHGELNIYVEELQKRVIRLVSESHHIAHTGPLFKLY